MIKYFNGEEVKKGDTYFRPAIVDLDDSEIIEKLPRFKTLEEANYYANVYIDEHYDDFDNEWLDIIEYYRIKETSSMMARVWRNVFGTYEKIYERVEREEI